MALTSLLRLRRDLVRVVDAAVVPRDQVVRLDQPRLSLVTKYVALAIDDPNYAEQPPALEPAERVVDPVAGDAPAATAGRKTARGLSDAPGADAERWVDVEVVLTPDAAATPAKEQPAAGERTGRRKSAQPRRAPQKQAAERKTDKRPTDETRTQSKKPRDSTAGRVTGGNSEQPPDQRKRFGRSAAERERWRQLKAGRPAVAADANEAGGDSNEGTAPSAGGDEAMKKALRRRRSASNPRAPRTRPAPIRDVEAVLVEPTATTTPRESPAVHVDSDVEASLTESRPATAPAKEPGPAHPPSEPQKARRRGRAALTARPAPPEPVHEALQSAPPASTLKGDLDEVDNDLEVDFDELSAAPLRPTSCTIAVWRGYRKACFYAGTTDERGEEVALAESAPFRFRGNGAPEQTEEALAAHRALVELLRSQGWRESPDKASDWFATTLTRS